MAESSSREVLPRLSQEQNFNNWKFRVKLLLEEKQVWSVIESGVVKPETEEFIKMDAKAKNVIVQCLSDKYLEIVKKCKTAKEMMHQLEYTFERKSIFNKLYLKRKLITLKCGKSEKLQDYFLKFDSIICELTAAGCTVDEMDKVCYLLSSMPTQYDNVITSIETMTTEKTVDIEFVKARLLDAEVKEQNCDEKQQPQTAFLTCYNCGKPGHRANQCRSGQGRGQNHYKRRGSFRGQSRGQSRGTSRDSGSNREQGTSAMCEGSFSHNSPDDEA